MFSNNLELNRGLKSKLNFDRGKYSVDTRFLVDFGCPDKAAYTAATMTF